MNRPCRWRRWRDVFTASIFSFSYVPSDGTCVYLVLGSIRRNLVDLPKANVRIAPDVIGRLRFKSRVRRCSAYWAETFAMLRLFRRIFSNSPKGYANNVSDWIYRVNRQSSFAIWGIKSMGLLHEVEMLGHLQNSLIPS